MGQEVFASRVDVDAAALGRKKVEAERDTLRAEVERLREMLHRIADATHQDVDSFIKGCSAAHHNARAERDELLRAGAEMAAFLKRVEFIMQGAELESYYRVLRDWRAAADSIGGTK